MEAKDLKNPKKTDLVFKAGQIMNFRFPYTREAVKVRVLEDFTGQPFDNTDKLTRVYPWDILK